MAQIRWNLVVRSVILPMDHQSVYQMILVPVKAMSPPNMLLHLQRRPTKWWMLSLLLTNQQVWLCPILDTLILPHAWGKVHLGLHRRKQDQLLEVLGRYSD
jgi:hypothetical protein